MHAQLLSHVLLFETLPPGFSVHGAENFPGKNIGVGCHFLLQGIFLTQGSKPSLLLLLHWQADSLPLHHMGSPFHEFTHTLHVCMHAESLSHVRLFAAPWAVACQAPLPIEFSRQEYLNGSPFHPPGDLPDPGIKAASLASPALAGRFFITSATKIPRSYSLHFLKFYDS